MSPELLLILSNVVSLGVGLIGKIIYDWLKMGHHTRELPNTENIAFVFNPTELKDIRTSVDSTKQELEVIQKVVLERDPSTLTYLIWFPPGLSKRLSKFLDREGID